MGIAIFCPDFTFQWLHFIYYGFEWVALLERPGAVASLYKCQRGHGGGNWRRRFGPSPGARPSAVGRGRRSSSRRRRAAPGARAAPRLLIRKCTSRGTASSFFKLRPYLTTYSFPVAIICNCVKKCPKNVSTRLSVFLKTSENSICWKMWKPAKEPWAQRGPGRSAATSRGRGLGA